MMDQARKLATTNQLRASFAAAMSNMYRREVPAYGDLVDLVESINRDMLETDPDLLTQLKATGELNRLSAERHGAIRLGTDQELNFIRRIFALMGMLPVGYYDLTAAGLPVHATAFRPVADDALHFNSFRIFCSVLRLELIEDDSLRADAEKLLQSRDIFSDELRALVTRSESYGAVSSEDAPAFIEAVLDVFRWRSEANVSLSLYERFLGQHRLIADIVCFKGPHINHLTPRTLDIDAVQVGMPGYGITPKAVIEGPPRRTCPILLRQTAFKALSEPVNFPNSDGATEGGIHTARFGEIEQRGIALTPSGHALYNELLGEARSKISPDPDGTNAAEYAITLEDVFKAFPDDWETLRRDGLAYFNYQITSEAPAPEGADLETLIQAGYIKAIPITYEDFLPVSAAGIFRSNLGDQQGESFAGTERQAAFEEALGTAIIDPYTLYAHAENGSLEVCRAHLSKSQRTDA
jgi:2-oxoadipate dioxygenase/decarboxylase